MKLKLPIAVVVITILATTLAYGQSSSRVMARLSVPFKFVILKKEMPAGTYEILKRSGTSADLALRNSETGTTLNLTIIERLAHEGKESDKGRFVFNMVGDQRYLSEFWPSGGGDGYLLQVTKQEHQHEIVK